MIVIFLNIYDKYYRFTFSYKYTCLFYCLVKSMIMPSLPCFQWIYKNVSLLFAYSGGSLYF